MADAELEVETPEPTLREQIESARDEVVARQTTEEPSEPQEEPKAEGKARDASGRFIPDQRKAEGGSTGADQPTERRSPAPDAQGSQQPAVPVQTQAPVTDAPTGWTAAEKTLWAQVPQQVKAVIQRREADFHRAITAQDEVRNIGNEFMRAAAQYAPVVQRTGMAPVQLWNQYLEMVRTIQTADPQQRAAIFKDLAVRNGADISGLGPQNVPPNNPSPQGAQSVHPMLMTLAQQVQAMKREQDEYKQRQESERQAREQAEMQETASEIEVFRSNPERQHFEAVKDLMASILRGGVAQTLEEAYNLAVKAHPQVSSQIEAEAKAAAQKAAADKAKSEKARLKAGSIRSSPGGFNPSEKPGSIRDELKKAFAEVGNRV